MLQLAVVAALVAVLAGAAQAVTGFGFSMVAIPLLAIASDSHVAVVGVTLLAVLLTVVAAARERGHAQWRTVRLVSIAGVVGMPFGLLALHVASERALTLLIGVMVLISVVVLIRGLHLAPGTASTLTAGGLSGALLTSTGMNGPPLVAAFQAMKLAPRAFRATLQATFCVQDVIAVLGFLVIGQVSSDALVVAGAGAPGVLVGWFVGDRAFHRIPPVVFRALVLGLMVLIGMIALGRAIMA